MSASLTHRLRRAVAAPTAPARSDRTDAEPAFRWVVLAAVALTLAVAMGQLVNGMSVYVVPLGQAFGWPRAEIALINTIGLVGMAVGGIVIGRLVDRVGTRRVVLVAAPVFGLCILLASRAEALWHFYVLFGIAGVVGGGAMFAPLIALVGHWFRQGAGLAIGIASAGQALGQGAVPFGTAHLIEWLGWRGAMVTQGLLSLALLLPLAMLLRDPPWRQGAAAAAPLPSPPLPLPSRVAVPWLSLAVVGCCACMSVPLMHLVPLIQGCGVPAPAAGGVLFLMLSVAIFGRVAFGKLADRIGAIPAYLTASLWQTMLVYLFTQAQTLDAFYALSAIYGFGYAGVMTAVLMTARELTDPARRASQMGTIVAFAWVGHGLGGLQGGLFYDLTGGYQWTYANAAVAGVFNLLLVGALYWRVHRQRRPRSAGTPRHALAPARFSA